MREHGHNAGTEQSATPSDPGRGPKPPCGVDNKRSGGSPAARLVGLWIGLRGAIRARFRQARLRSQLIVLINATLAVVIVLMVSVDLWHSLNSRIHEKEVALSEEARTVVTAFVALQGRGDEQLQSFLDETCALMNADDSPGHSITATTGGRSYFANPAVHADHLKDNDRRVVSGTFDRGGVHVSVSETLAPLLKTAVRAGVWRLGAILLAGLLAAALLNVLLLHLVTRPLERLEGAVRAIGHGALDTTVPVGANAELDGLARQITAMSRDLGQRESARNTQLARSRRLQAHLNSASHHANGISFCIEYHPADEVAGDFVDVIECRNGDTLVCLADVVGHGIHAAMEAAVLKALLLSIATNDAGPGSILRVLNERFYRTSLPEDFASMVMLRISRDRNRVTYANAGHEPGLIRSATGASSIIRSTGLLLGVIEDSEYEEESVELTSGDVILLLSDGITESQNAEGKLLGRAAVRDAVSRVPVADAHLAALAALRAARQHRGDIPSHDDETVVAIGMIMESHGTCGPSGGVVSPGRAIPELDPR